MMTFPDNAENDMQGNARTTSHTDIGIALKEVLTKALEAERLACGVFACAKLLSSNPDSVSLCVLPDVNPTFDVTIDIQHKLIEAYCWENDIPVIKVDSIGKLEVLCTSKTGSSNGLSTSYSDLTDLSCVLIECPPNSPDKDETISKFYNNILTNDVYPRPIIDLPV